MKYFSFVFFFQPLKNAKAILSLWAPQKQMVSEIWPPWAVIWWPLSRRLPPLLTQAQSSLVTFLLLLGKWQPLSLGAPFRLLGEAPFSVLGEDSSGLAQPCRDSSLGCLEGHSLRPVRSPLPSACRSPPETTATSTRSS